jgi:hypothetical protein
VQIPGGAFDLDRAAGSCSAFIA